MFGLEISSVPAILPTIEQVLHANFKQLQWIMNAYTIAVTTVLMATGILADRYGRKRTFFLSVVIFGIASLACGLTSNANVLIAYRFLQGASGGAMLICQIAILSSQFRDAKERGRAFGAWGIVFGLGLGFGPIIGGATVAVSNWRWVFLVHVLIAVLTACLTLFGVRETRDPDPRRLDLAGIVTLSLFVSCLTYVITQGPDLGFGSPTALSAAGLAALSLIAFLIAERVSPNPMFDLSVFRIRNFSGALLGSAGMNFSFWPFMIYLPIYFQGALGYDGVAAGLSLLAYTMPTLLFPPLGERLSLRYQPRVVIPAGLFTIGLGFMLMRWGSGVDRAGWLTMLPGCLVAGIGLGLTNTPVTNTTTAAVPSARAGMASGIDMSARMIALAVNIAIMGFILVEGTAASLKLSLADTLDGPQLRSLAEAIAAGGAAPADLSRLDAPGASGAVLRSALSRGFGWVMLYGGAAVWLLAAASLATFGRRAAPSLGTVDEPGVATTT
jgi:EmrB/QacA subfamily drug resistance transporter